MHASDVKVEVITAERAREYLAYNEQNRPLSWLTINKYASDMVAGRWMLSTDMIGFDTTGRLIQGQHRLNAVLVAEEKQPGIEVPMMVGWGFPPSSYDVLDQGRMRSAAHVLMSHGMGNVARTAAMARQLLYYDTYPDTIWRAGADGISRVKVINWALEHRAELEEAAPGSMPRIPATYLNTVSWVSLRYLVNRDSDNEERWDEFQHGAFTGENLPPGSPMLRLRNGEILSKWGLSGAQPRLGAYIKAWNAYVEGRSLQALLFRKNELPMPRVI